MNRFNCMTNRQTALARCDASDTSGRHGLYGHCVVCGATAYDWRALIGIGARLARYAADPATALLTHPGACGACGASELEVCALGAKAAQTTGTDGPASDWTTARHMSPVIGHCGMSPPSIGGIVVM
jgi:hypothetical protein